MTTDLAAVQQLPGRPDLAERYREAARAVASGIRDAKAGTTRRVYASAWQQFLAWAEAGGHLAAEGKAMAIIEQAGPRSPTSTLPPACRRATTPPGTPWWPRP